MSALYGMNYVGQTGAGGGCIYLGNGKIVGMDIAGGRYHGSYTIQNNQMTVSVRLTMVTDGVLVTGRHVPKGTRLDLSAVWPVNFADGKPQPIQVAGSTVHVVFEKVGDI
jgi:hypothetical protein